MNLSPEARKQLMDVCAILGVEFSTHDDTVPHCLRAITERLAVLVAAQASIAKRLHQLERDPLPAAGPVIAQARELPVCPTCQGKKTVMSAGKPVTLPGGAWAYEALESICPTCNGTGVTP